MKGAETVRGPASDAPPHRTAAWVVLTCASVLLVPTLARAADPDDIPVIGRPVEFPFSEASAGFVQRGKELLCPFEVKVNASPTQVEVEQPVTVTVDITALGPVRRPPVRLDLRELASVTRSFFVEDMIDGQKEKVGPTAWRWTYRLKPKRAGIDEVPRLPFVFYNPDLRPVEKAFQVIWTDPVALKVRPTDTDDRIPPVSDHIRSVMIGPAVLVDARPWAGPTPWLLTTIAAGPPLVCVAWYLTWRRLYPDAARRAQLRRSRAARRALASLTSAGRLTGRQRAEAVARAIVGYLRERFDLPVTEPTPDEAVAWLARCGQTELVDRLRQLLVDCAIERFGPDEAGPDVVVEARAFIADVEDRSCVPS